MKHILLIVTLIVGWVAFGAPVPFLHLSPMQPNAAVPTFEQALTDGETLRAAIRRGEVQEDPAPRELRQNVLRAARRLEQSPCSNSNRDDLSKAVGAYMKARLASTEAGKPIEPVSIGGRVLDAHKIFDTEANTIVDEAMMLRLVKREHLPSVLAGAMAGAPAFALDGMRGKYACG